MEWDLFKRKSWEKVEMAASESGHKIHIPRKHLPEYLFFYYQAFFELSSCRHVGMSLGPIPWSDINDYAYRHKIFNYDFDVFCDYLSTIDSRYLSLKKGEK